MTNVERNSAHELLRIVAMFLIVWYHLVSYYLYFIPHDTSFDSFIEAAMPSLHIGVVLFLLISGYHGIKPSISGFIKLVLIVAIYYLPLQIVELGIDGELCHPRRLLRTFQFISYTPYWFVRTYLFLYILSPIINSFILQANRKTSNIMLVTLGVISVYFGTMQGDPSLSGGKNIVNFMFIYLLGHTIKQYRFYWERIKSSYLVVAFLIVNAIIIISLSYFHRDSGLGETIWRYTFPYCSPVLLMNASILFMIFSKLSFHSKIINSIAASMFSVYLIHCHPLVHKACIIPLQNGISGIIPAYMMIWMFVILSVVIITICVTIDKFMFPVWKYNKILCTKVEQFIMTK